MNGNEYLQQAREKGKKITRERANTLEYVFITELDGWLSILQYNNNTNEYVPIIQACNREKALSYIAMIEPINVPINEI